MNISEAGLRDLRKQWLNIWMTFTPRFLASPWSFQSMDTALARGTVQRSMRRGSKFCDPTTRFSAPRISWLALFSSVITTTVRMSVIAAWARWNQMLTALWTLVGHQRLLSRGCAGNLGRVN